MTKLEEAQTKGLFEAQPKAEALFHEVEAHGLIRPGITESRLNEDIYSMAKEMYGITTYWHKRIVRASCTGQFSQDVRSSTAPDPVVEQIFRERVLLPLYLLLRYLRT